MYTCSEVDRPRIVVFAVDARKFQFALLAPAELPAPFDLREGGTSPELGFLLPLPGPVEDLGVSTVGSTRSSFPRSSRRSSRFSPLINKATARSATTSQNTTITSPGLDVVLSREPLESCATCAELFGRSVV